MDMHDEYNGITPKKPQDEEEAKIEDFFAVLNA